MKRSRQRQPASTDLPLDAAREARDIAIECVDRLNFSISVSKETCDERYFHRHRRVVAQLMSAFCDVIDAAWQRYPKLLPNTRSWRRVGRQRRGAEPPPRSRASAMKQTAIVGQWIPVLLRMGPEVVGKKPTLQRRMHDVKAILAKWPNTRRRPLRRGATKGRAGERRGRYTQ